MWVNETFAILLVGLTVSSIVWPVAPLMRNHTLGVSSLLLMTFLLTQGLEQWFEGRGFVFAQACTDFAAFAVLAMWALRTRLAWIAVVAGLFALMVVAGAAFFVTAGDTNAWRITLTVLLALCILTVFASRGFVSYEKLGDRLDRALADRRIFGRTGWGVTGRNVVSGPVDRSAES